MFSLRAVLLWVSLSAGKARLRRRIVGGPEGNLRFLRESSIVRAERLLSGTGEVLLERCWMADRPWSRMRGLLGRDGLAQGEGLLLKPCGSVHTFFMRFPIDVVFLDRELSVVAVRPELPAWRTAGARGAKVALELAAGEAARLGIKTGDRFRPAQEGVSSPERR